MTDRVPPSPEVTAHARHTDGTCWDAACPARRYGRLILDLQTESAEVRLRMGKLMVEVDAALSLEAVIELRRAGGA